jgi:D-alanyl-D-alanine dipeptidase
MKYLNATHPIALIVLAAIVFGIVLDAQANDVEQKFIAAGLVDVHGIDPTVQIDLVNSDPQKNYFRENFYDGLNKAYLRKAVAIKLSKAQTLLKSKHPDFSLQILDAARPRSVSKKMYTKMKGTKFERYVADPAKGSMHNYGIALDITIVDGTGNELDMGFSPFRKSDTEIYWQFAKLKLGSDLTETQTKNRQLLSDTMKSAGFLPLRHEWWHFDGMLKDEAQRQFRIIE